MATNITPPDRTPAGWLANFCSAGSEYNESLLDREKVNGSVLSTCSGKSIQPVHVYNHSSSNKRLKSGTGSQKEVDSILAKALMDLGLKDRTSIEQEIHGVTPQAEEETPEQRAAMLTDFETELVKAYVQSPTHPDLAAYHLAVKEQYQYTTSPGNELSRLKFIRVEEYDIGRAVKRFLVHLNYLLEFFGPESLQRPLQMDDLNYNPATGRRETTSGALKYLKTGSFQVLPGRDRAGRRVFFHDFGPKGQTLYDEIKATFFLYTIIADLESIHRKRGMILIGHLGSLTGQIVQHYSDNGSLRRVETGMAHRLSAVHLCISASNDFIFKAAMALISSVSSRVHSVIRIHESSSILELQHRLMSFGLPTEDTNFPLTTGGKLKRKNLNDWMQCRRNMDNLIRLNRSLPHAVVECPDPKDVLFSMKHKRDKRQLGNQELRRLIDRDYVAFHQSPARSEQRDLIIRNVIREIVLQWRGRFLVWNDEMLWWDELAPSAVIFADGCVSGASSPNGYQSANSDLETKIRKKFNSTGRHGDFL